MELDVHQLHYHELNRRIREVLAAGNNRIELRNVSGQRFIGDGLVGSANLDIFGIPGNDLASFMNGPTVRVHNNAQDTCANTLNNGKLIIEGNAGDVLGYSMRGGRVYVLGNVGYRAGIHMKSYQNQVPVIIVGGSAGDFSGEYMAGGVLILLGMHGGRRGPVTGNYCGVGMHGGTIYVRGEVNPTHLGKDVEIRELSSQDLDAISGYLKDYCAEFDLSLEDVMSVPFVKLVPSSARPYGHLYAY